MVSENRDAIAALPASKIALEVHDMTVAYRRKPVLWDIDLTVPEGNLVGIVGPNGAGKSTFIKSVLGLVNLASGKVEIYGKPYQEQRHLVGYVPQRETVDWDFPVTVLDVVLMGTYGRLGWFRRAGKAERALALECLEQVELSDFADRQIRQLSGGQQQRVFLARALAQDAKVYFMDEPFAGVDAATEAAILRLLQKLRSAGKTVFVVHHDLQTTREYFDWVVLLNLRLLACGPIETTFTNANLHKTYGGRLTILDQAAEAVRRQAPE
ncbi:metal ABC transporter ATP-binding protein [Aeoliella mucimassa]|uniref:High-affinity zinc uptake system ATP-binding protein ZnuC n=1 Tax=Aeoliella mucimassa TaxID=2527972 RepID=A0A518AQ04_9BACT|nr:metal ABC transporter ATP-binding protein [Aeoliella mucimassa]QDU56801.1 High-affinity zinc uptake system ATP-binding protein ZnuC [Aeoliella mucimassa]